MFVNLKRFEGIIERVGPDHHPVTLRALIPVNKVGAMMGERGKVHRQIQDLHDVQIYMHSQPNRHGRLVSVFGGAHKVSQAWRSILFWLFCSRREYRYDQNARVSFLVPAFMIDWLLEHRELDRIHKTTNAEIHLQRTPLKMTTEHLLTFSIATSNVSYLDMFEMAVFMLATHFQNHPDKVMSPNNVYYIPHTTDSEENSSTRIARDDVLLFVPDEDGHQRQKNSSYE